MNKFIEKSFIRNLDNSKIKQLGWHPRPRLNEGIKMTYSWYLENIDHENE